jgi:hypothetical protein
MYVHRLYRKHGNSEVPEALQYESNHYMLGIASIHHQCRLALYGESRGHETYCPPALRTTESATIITVLVA